jgi:DNA repair exonuclease SbcCD ATPase subunit
MNDDQRLREIRELRANIVRWFGVHPTLVRSVNGDIDHLLEAYDQQQARIAEITRAAGELEDARNQAWEERDLSWAERDAAQARIADYEKLLSATGTGLAEYTTKYLDACDRIDAYEKAAPLCDKHQPTGGARGRCLVCALMKNSRALSRIDYAVGGWPNEMGVSTYDVECDEEQVVKRVQARIAALEAEVAEQVESAGQWMRQLIGDHEELAEIVQREVPARREAEARADALQAFIVAFREEMPTLGDGLSCLTGATDKLGWNVPQPERMRLSLVRLKAAMDALLAAPE